MKDRYQFVSLGINNSSKLPVKYGVPQGSVLGPLLFNVFINDLPNVSDIMKTVLFADDTTLLCSGKNFENLMVVINEELAKYKKWFDCNHLTINFKKTNYIIFGPKILTKNLASCLYIDQIPIEQVHQTKFLGFIITENLSWLDHILYISSKISKTIGILFKIRSKLSLNIMIKMYYSLIYPYLIYGIILWGNSAHSHLLHLNLVHNSFIRCLFMLRKFEHITKFYTKANLLNLYQIYYLFCLKFMYKIKNNILTKNFVNMFHPAKSTTWSFRFVKNFQQPFPRLKIVQSSIISCGVTFWNKLPIEYKQLNNIHLFNKHVKSGLTKGLLC